MQEQVLRIATHFPYPMILAAFAVVLAVLVFIFILRKNPLVAWTRPIAIVILGLAPLLASNISEWRGVYHVRVVVLEPDKSVVDYAKVRSTYGGQLKMVEGGWDLDIPRQAQPADGKVTFFAAVNDEFVIGKSTLVLAQDYYPTATIQLVADTSAKVRGVVMDEDLRAVAGASVSIAGSSDVAVTDQAGNFVLPAHAGKGQKVEIRAQKGRLVGNPSAPAGKVVEVILNNE